ncbi:MAG: dihydroorotate dehydrogenase [Spirochaetes bacterium]|nr:dihydroorotate dehydrogenase [Spirochaetota bacterium]
MNENIDMTVQLGRLTLKNPVGVASGTFGYGEEYSALLDVDALGALYTKAVTPEVRAGNQSPRLADTPAGMLNSIGLANPGLDSFIQHKLPLLRQRKCAVMVNVAGCCPEDYIAVIERLEQEAGIAGYEINISCPNVKAGGMALGTDPAVVERLTRQLSDRTTAGGRPLVVKLSPNVTDICAIARAAEAGGAAALSCINTLVGMVIDVKQRRPVLAMGSGGLSGPAIRPVGVACVYKVSRAVSIPVIGLGGITNTDDALQYFLAGAAAIQVGTALFTRPETPLEILTGLRAFMADNAIAKISDLPGLLQS